MMDRTDLLKSSGYWTQLIQLSMYNTVNDYLKQNKLTRSAFAEKIGVSKGYISQVLNGDFDHKLSKLVELSLACGYVPSLTLVPSEQAEEVVSGYLKEHFTETGPFLQARTYTSEKKPLNSDTYIAPQIKFTPVKVA